MPRRFDHQLVLLFAVLLAGGIALYGSYAIEQNRATAERLIERQALNLAGSIAGATPAIESEDSESLEAILLPAEHFDGVLAAAITDAQGKALAALRRGGTSRMQPEAIEAFPDLPAGGAATLTRPHGRADGPLVAWSPVKLGGWVRLEISAGSERVLHGQVLSESFALGTAIVLLAAAALLTYLRRPLAQLGEATLFARSLDNGGHRPLLARGGSMEMEALMGALGRIARRMADQSAAAAQSEEKHRDVLDNLVELVFQTDAEGRWTYLNQAWERITGHAPADTLGRSTLEFIPAEERESAQSSLKPLLSGDSDSLRRALRFRTREGSLRCLETSIRALRDETGQLLGLAGSAADVTERQFAQERLQDQLYLMQQLIEVIPTPVYIKDAKGRYQGFNKAFGTLFGKRRRDFLGKSVFDLFAPELARWHDERDRALIAQGGNQTFEAQVSDAAGLLRDTIYHKARFSRSDGKVAGIVGVITDITQRKVFERELIAAKVAAEAASEAKSAFLANMSHEIRTPMNAIIGMTDLALETKLDAEQKAQLTLVKQSADTLLTIINDVLDFSRVDSSRIEFDRIHFSLHDCVALATREIEPRARERGLELRCVIPESVPDEVSGDPYRLRQVLLKLLGNAVKFTERGTVTVTIEEEGHTDAPPRLRFAVSDSGMGISPEKQGLIFDAFAQADPSATRRHGGTGLGLAICARLVEGMGGSLAVDSVPGAGSTFHFSVPLHAGALPVTVATPPGQQLQGVRALVVGAAQAGGQQVEPLLRAWGIDARSTQTETEAGTMLDAARADGLPLQLVVLGNPAAGGDACSIAEGLIEHAGEARIVVVTAAGLRGDAARCRKLGVSAYLTHPVSEQDLLQALQVVIGKDRDSPATELVTRHSLRERRRHLSLLLAEGDPAARKLALRLLGKLGHHTTLARDCRDAVEHARSEVFDAILVDLDVPDRGGIETSRQLRALELARGTRTPIVAMSAHPMAGEREQCLAAGIDSYMPKPLEISRLMQVLDGIGHASKAAAPGVAPVAAPVFDRKSVLDNLGGDTELLQALAMTFVDTHGDMLAKLSGAVREGDWDGSYRAAHALKGAAGNFGSAAVTEAALAVERAAKNAAAAETAAAARQLASLIDTLARALRQEIDDANVAA